MGFAIRNSWKYLGKTDGLDWWEWEAFVDDDGSGAIDEVEAVDYILHPTYPRPKRTVSDRRSGFSLMARGLGGFTLNAFLRMKDGSTQRLRHLIEVNFDPPQGESGSSEELTKSVQAALHKRGYYEGPIDGVYGSQTADAVKAFQRDKGLVIDGFAGPHTRAQLSDK
jgi:hypothetical protein